MRGILASKWHFILRFDGFLGLRYPKYVMADLARPIWRVKDK